jgi:hypothetical protein
MKRYFATAVVVLLALSACRTTPRPIQNSPVATQAALQQSPLSTPEAVAVVTTPGADAGTVTGVLMVGTGQNAKPTVNVVLYLAATIKDTSGKETIAGMDRVRSPRANTDGQGRFVFTNVPPGRYGFVLDVVTNSYLLHQPDTGESLVISVTPGKATDLGTLRYDTLPLQGTPP